MVKVKCLDVDQRESIKLSIKEANHKAEEALFKALSQVYSMEKSINKDFPKRPRRIFLTI